jgi:flavin-dependent dehydrogenase
MQKIVSDPTAPVEISGAGPAGLAAAITLARAGRQVVVHEAQKEVGHRFGGDFQGLENWSSDEDVLSIIQRQGLATDFSALPCYHGTAFDARGKNYTIKSEEPLFYLVERGPGPGPGTLDSTLLRQAQDLGVEICFNSRLHKVAGEGILAAGPRAAGRGPPTLLPWAITLRPIWRMDTGSSAMIIWRLRVMPIYW